MGAVQGVARDVGAIGSDDVTALSYSIRDSEDREVARESTLARARNTARKYGPGSVVLGARGQVVYTVPQVKEPKS